MVQYKKINLGQSLIEVLVAIGIASAILPALLTGLVSGREGKAQEDLRLRATILLKEAQEATRVVREASWNAFAINGTYHPEILGNSWKLTTGDEQIGDFTRSVVIADIAPHDPSIKLVTIKVSWGGLSTSFVSTKGYFSRYLDNITYLETLESQFNLGTKTSTVITNNAGGEVQLAAGGHADWCKPALSIAPADLPKSGVANAISAIEGRVFAGTGDNASGVSFANVSIGNTNPPNSSILGTFDGYKTNDIYGETNYAYLATDTNAKEIEIVNLSTNPYSEAGYFDSPGPTDANSVFVVGNIGYMTAGNKFYTFDLSSKSGSRQQLGVVTLAGTGNSIFVAGNYAFVATSAESAELQIVDVSSASAPTIVGQADINGEEGRDVFVNPTATRAYLATELSVTQAELFVINVTSKTGNQPILGSYDANGMDPKGVTVVSSNRAIIVGAGAEEYQVINTTIESTLVRCGGMDVSTGINGVSSVLESDGDAYSYIITGDAGSELKIIEGGPGGPAGSIGTFESATFDAGSKIAFNRFVATETEPAGTGIAYQMAASDVVGGSCFGASFVFVGPDGTSNTFFNTGGPIPLSQDGVGYENPAQCFRYKIFLSSNDISATPIMSDITINYSP